MKTKTKMKFISGFVVVSLSGGVFAQETVENSLESNEENLNSINSVAVVNEDSVGEAKDALVATPVSGACGAPTPDAAGFMKKLKKKNPEMADKIARGLKPNWGGLIKIQPSFPSKNLSKNSIESIPMGIPMKEFFGTVSAQIGEPVYSKLSAEFVESCFTKKRLKGHALKKDLKKIPLVKKTQTKIGDKFSNEALLKLLAQGYLEKEESLESVPQGQESLERKYSSTHR